MRMTRVAGAAMAVLLCGAVAGGLHGCATSPADAETAARAAAALKSSFNARGQAGLDRLDQDETQKLCSEYANRPLPASVAETIQQANLATIRYPADGTFVG